MEKELNLQYEAPQVEVIEVVVEKGFEASATSMEAIYDGGSW